MARPNVARKTNKPSVARKTIDTANRREPASTADQPKNRRKTAKPKKVVRDIQLLQKVRKCDLKPLCIPKAAFCRVVKDVLTMLSPTGEPYRIQSSALEALHLSCESYMIQLFEDMVLCQRHAKRVTLMFNDFQLVSMLRSGWGDKIMMAICKRGPPQS